MIVRIEAQFEEVERDGWLCANLTGVYTVTRIDSSKRDVNHEQLLALLRNEPLPKAAENCPKCGGEGTAFHAEADGFNRMCNGGCGPYRVNEREPEDLPEDL